MSERSFLLLVNPRTKHATREVERVEARLARENIAVTTVVLKKDVDASAVLDSEAAGKDAVLVLGGDGTLDRTVRGMLANGLPLGILPTGENNSVARSLDIPANIETALNVILDGEIGRIDVAEVNGNPFLGVAVVGNNLETAINRSMAVRAEKGVVRQMVHAVRFALSAKIFMVTLGYDDEQGHHERPLYLLQLVVANNHPFKGRSGLDVYALRVKRWRDLLLLFPMLIRGVRALWPAVEQFHADKLEVYARTAQPVYADDRKLAQTPAVFKVREQALQVFVPKG